MKKILLVASLMAAFMLGACSTGTASADCEDRLQIVYSTMTEKILVDTTTGVQYLCLYKGGSTVMVDAEGKPLIWEGASDQ